MSTDRTGPEPAAEPGAGAAAGTVTTTSPAGTRPRRRWTGALAAVLAGLLGFGIVAATRPGDQAAVLSTARESDLVQLLDDLDQRQQRLEQQRAELTEAARRLESTDEQERLQEAQRRAQTLAILAGTAPASGPGIVMTIDDPERRILSPVLLNAVQELRDAGAIAMSIGEQRVVAQTWFADGSRPGTIEVSGEALEPPYVFRVVGDPQTLATAMQIPGGVSDSVGADGGRIAISERDEVTVTALQPLRTPQYAAPVRPTATP